MPCGHREAGAGPAGRRRRYAAAVASPRSGKYGRHPDGMFGVARRMYSTGWGTRGFVRSTISISCRSLLPFFRLHGAHEVTTFSQTESPPRLLGTMWSSVSRPPLDPQYAQRQPSRANSARREIFRWTVRGTET